MYKKIYKNVVLQNNYKGCDFQLFSTSNINYNNN